MKRTEEYNLKELYLELVKEWDYEKNEKGPEEYTPGSNQKVWWICKNGHSYDASIDHRTNKKNPRGCPYCTGSKPSPKYNLKVLYPEIIQGWDYDNNKKGPEEYTPGSNKEVNWICKNGHSFKLSIKGRITSYKGKTKVQGCGICDGKIPTKEYNLKVIHPDIAKEWYYEKNEKNPEEYTPYSQKKVHWICEKGHPPYPARIYSRTGKNKTGCPFCSGNKPSPDYNLKILYPELAEEWDYKKNKKGPEDYTPGSNEIVWWICKKGHSNDARIYSRTHGHGCRYCSPKTSSFEIRVYSELLTPFDNVEWREKQGDKRIEVDIYIPEYKVGIEVDGYYYHDNREKEDEAKNKKLNAIGIKLVRLRQNPLNKISTSDIVFKHEISKSNINQFLKEMLPALGTDSKKRVEDYVERKNFSGVKKYNELISILPGPLPEESLLQFPNLCDEWDYQENYPLRPENFPPGSHKKVLWKCKKGHSFPQRINDRTNAGTKCPYCSHKKASAEYNLKVLYPELVKEWDYDKNKKETKKGPEEYTPGSDKKVWWICKRGHSFKSTIRGRTKGHGCKTCSSMDRLRATPDYNLKVLYPELIDKEWDYDKNEKGPEEYTPASTRKVWWICPNGHSHDQVIASRIRGHECRFCPKKGRRRNSTKRD